MARVAEILAAIFVEVAPTIPVVYISGDSAADWHAHGVPESIMIEAIR